MDLTRMRRKKRVTNASFEERNGFKTMGGHVADVRPAFTTDGQFLLVSSGTSVLVLRSNTGTVVQTINSFHEETITSLTMLDVKDFNHQTPKKSFQTCVSKDLKEYVAIWELSYDTPMNNDIDLRFNCKLIQGFYLHDLKITNSVLDCSLIRHSIMDLHFHHGFPKGSNRLSLVLVIESRIDSKSQNQPFKNETSSYPNSLSKSPYQVVIEVVEVPLAAIYKDDFDNSMSQLFSYPYETQQRDTEPGYFPIIKSAVAQTGHHIAVTINKQLVVWNRPTNTIIQLTHTDVLSTISIHPGGRFVATGDGEGRILWWHILEPNLFLKGGATSGEKGTTLSFGTTNSNTTVKATHEAYLIDPLLSLSCSIPGTGRSGDCTTVKAQRRQIPVSVQHWHAHMVRSIVFNGNGTELISSGEEGVLVFWHTTENTRRFLPRFGAPIHGIVPSLTGSLLAVSMGDNSIKILDLVSNTMLAMYQGIRMPLSLLKLHSVHPTAITVKQRDYLPISLQQMGKEFLNRKIVVGSGITHAGLGPNSTLQFYDFESDSSIGTLMVNYKNFVSRVDHGPKRHQWTVQRVAMSPDGCRLVTVEFRESMFRTLQKDLEILTSSREGDWDISLGHEKSDYVQLERIKDKKDREEMKLMKLERGSKKVKMTDSRNEWYDGISNSNGIYDDKLTESGSLYLMKFWDITTNDQGIEISTELITTVESPHVNNISSLTVVSSDPKLSNCIFHFIGECQRLLPLSSQNPSEFDFISSSLDSTWRVWRRHISTTRDHQVTITYICIHTGTFRSLPAHDLVLSGDSSMAAIAHPSSISLWGQSIGYKQRCIATEIFIDVLPIPLIPHSTVEVDQLKVHWIESSFRVGTKHNEMDGEILLLASTGHYLFMWDMRAQHPSVVWCSKASEIPSLLIENTWGLPIFIMLYPQSNKVTIHEVRRNHLDHHISCPVIQTFTLDTQRRILGCTTLDDVYHPKIGLLDNQLQMKIYSVNSIIIGRTNEESIASVTPPCINDVIESNNEREQQKKVLEEQGSTSPLNDQNINDEVVPYSSTFLSSFLEQIHPAIIPSVSDSLQRIIGQSIDGSCYLIAPPSKMFHNMMDVYLPKRR